METFGIENLKKIISVGAKIGNIGGMTFQDGQINKDDLLVLPSFFELFPTLIAVQWTQIVPEAKDISESESAELIDWFKYEFNIPQDNVEVTIEQALSLINTVAQFIVNIIKAFKK